MMLCNLGVGVLTGCLLGPLLIGAPVYAAPEVPVVAVLNFENTTGDPQWAPLAESIPEALVTDLAHRGGLRLVERHRLQELMKEIALGMTGAIAADQAARVGEQVGAQIVVLGSYTVTGDQLELNARVVEVASGVIVHGEQKAGKVKEPGKVVRQLGAHLWAYWTGKPVPKDTAWYGRWWVWGGLAVLGGGVYAAVPHGEAAPEPLPPFPAPPQ